MGRQDVQDLEKGSFIRQRLHGSERSETEKYRELVTGERGMLALIRYELLTGLLGPLPGGLGILLRRRFYRRLFREMGRGVIFGRNVVIRHADKIRLGSRVVIDDNAVIDGRGAADEGVVIGDDAILNRGVIVQSKEGPIEIGQKTSIGSGTVIVSMGGVKIGRSVLVAGGCYLSGGMYHTERIDIPISEQGVYSRGPVEIGEGSWLGMGATVLDAVSIGKGVVVGAGAVVTRDLPDFAVATGVPAEIQRIRKPLEALSR